MNLNQDTVIENCYVVENDSHIKIIKITEGSCIKIIKKSNGTLISKVPCDSKECLQ